MQHTRSQNHAVLNANETVGTVFNTNQSHDTKSLQISAQHINSNTKVQTDALQQDIISDV